MPSEADAEGVVVWATARVVVMISTDNRSMIGGSQEVWKGENRILKTEHFSHALNAQQDRLATGLPGLIGIKK